MSNEQTFDLDNQPGIRKTPISRAEFASLAEVLGLDPAYVISLEASGKRVLVTALLQTTDEAKALGGGKEGGYLKHTYEIPLADELCERGNIVGSNLGEDRMTPVFLSPDCRDENCRKCDLQAWDDINDQPTVCGCDCHWEEA